MLLKLAYVHTKLKVVGKLSKTLSHWQLYGCHPKSCQSCHCLQPKHCHIENPNLVPCDNLLTTLTTFGDDFKPLGCQNRNRHFDNPKVVKLTTGGLHLDSLKGCYNDNHGKMTSLHGVAKTDNIILTTIKLSNWQLFEYLMTTVCFVCFKGCLDIPLLSPLCSCVMGPYASYSVC